MVKNGESAFAEVCTPRLRRFSAKVCAAAVLLCWSLVFVSACAGIPASHAGEAVGAGTSSRTEMMTSSPEAAIDEKMESISNAPFEASPPIETETPPPADTPAPNGSDDGLEPVSGTYRGQTIAMCLRVSETDWSSLYSYKANFFFSNGFARLRLDQGGDLFIDKNGEILDVSDYKDTRPFDAGGHALVQRADDTWVYMDANGGILDAVSYKDARFDPLFSDNAYALAQRANGLWVYMDASGEIRDPADADFPNGKPVGNVTPEGETVFIRMFGEPGAYYHQLFDADGQLLNDTKFERIGEFYRGLAPIVQDRRVGLMDTEGNVVIPPVFPYDESSYEISYESKHKVVTYSPYLMNEDAIVIPYDGKVAVLIVTRSQSACGDDHKTGSLSDR
ncbi:MAG: WG repeat-containing protein [Oscillospiraceae bacterium]|jgi:hypothetical protein|nr:WG repeat-containing protein [Oscillospiraceae bacterium]